MFDLDYHCWKFYPPRPVPTTGRRHLFMTKHRFDPFKHHRKSIRYKDWDYRTPGYYFITICTIQRQHLFDDPRIRQVAEHRLRQIPKHAKHTALDESIVMPNHAHLLLLLHSWPPSIITEPEKRIGRTNAQSGSVGAIIGNYKSQVTRRVNDLRGISGETIWQRGYWDRIVRNEEELLRIRKYIIDNPIRWEQDRDNLDSMLSRMTFHP